MTDSHIPPETIEAAARAIYWDTVGWQGVGTWETIRNKEHWTSQAHAALTAAIAQGGVAVMTDDTGFQRPEDETGFVIERYYGNTLNYWTGRFGQFPWSPKNDEALRFARSIDARVILVHFCDGIERVTEHCWFAAAPKVGETL